MDGSYRLRHRAIDQLATLAVSGASVRIHVPPAPATARTLASPAAAVAAMNAELIRLTEKGWSIVDVATAGEEPEEPPSAPEEARDEVAELVAEQIVRAGDAVTVKVDDDEVTAETALAVLRRALDGGCRELIIEGAHSFRAPWYQTVEPWCSALARLGGAAQLARFVVDTSFQPLTRQASVHCGDLTGLFRACPALELAHVIGWAPIESLAHERLEDLTLMADPIEPGTVKAVLRGPSPRLSRLALGLSYEQAAAPGADAALLSGLTGDGSPALSELHIAYPEDGAALLAGLVTCPGFARLRVLSIAGNVFDDEERGLAALHEHRAALAGLDALYLPLEDVMNHTDEELFALVPSLRSIDDVNPFAGSRYRAS
jgi:hypothetical protein